jgi:hypothetical protein
MTFEEKAISLLFNNGLMPKEAAAVVERIKAAPENKAMAGRWNDQIEGYPPQMIGVLWFIVRVHATQWIEENCPQAWFKAAFAFEDVKEAS